MTEIQAHMRFKLLVAGDASLPVPATFKYDTDRPLAVQATFNAAGDTVEWVFSRDILDSGLSGNAGLGDVRMWPSKEGGKELVYISLSSPEGDALLEIEASVIKAFLDQTYALVASGQERLMDNWDSALAELLS